MNKDQLRGAIKEAAGKVQRGFGQVVDSPKHQAKGSLKQAQGRAQQVRGDAKELVKDVLRKP
ncbi:CsbD family protein [Rubrivivax gelatinosus]|uniref:CsbD family protein n=1 Tax=Rubrivivax gelatinosus TaxID=28068 RepID=A0ABS1DXM5_RUBGE|nr:CsbD family protein [Rubrivivax gelatinosus]MBK1614594.1 CsbD family protein [Rubrivivax gelatinosus]MBK1714822.1 CsbD family protein [Rubrivivax gelatinosus]